MDVAVVETRQAQVETGRLLQLGEQSGEELLITGPADLVEREPQVAGLGN